MKETAFTEALVRCQRDLPVPWSGQNAVTCSPFFSHGGSSEGSRSSQNRYGREGARGSKGSISVVATQQHKQKQELDPSGCVLARAPSRKHRCLKGGKRKLGLQSESELHVHTKAKLRKEESISQQSVSLAASRGSITTVCA